MAGNEAGRSTFHADSPILQIRDLRTDLLKSTSFSLWAGECIAVRGPSGAGKTLLLRAIADLDPNEGLVCLDSRDRSTSTGPEWRRLVGYLLAEPGWWADTVGEHFSEWTTALALVRELEFPEEAKAWPIAGFVLQIDDPGLPDWWDMLKPEPIEAYRKFARLRIDAVNHALVGIPEERVRYHLCWGSWHGPHTHDLPLEHIIDLILEVRAQTYSFEAGNVRHEHEWRVWQEANLPAGKMLMPGVVSHATNLVEHPQLVADRILRYAAIVGRENIVAGTDCALGGRVHADLVWAKLRTLVEGARLASTSLWAS
jgi:hypothetical protein